MLNHSTLIITQISKSPKVPKFQKFTKIHKIQNSQNRVVLITVYVSIHMMGALCRGFHPSQPVVSLMSTEIANFAAFVEAVVFL